MILIKLISLLAVFPGFFNQVVLHDNRTNSVDVIYIQPTMRSSSIYGVIQRQQFFIKYQSTYTFSINSPSNTFTKIPGLTFVFSHSTPLLYKISFQGSCGTPNEVNYYSFLKIMIDDKILVSNTLLPNNNQRLNVAPSFGKNLVEIDSRGGWFVWANFGWDWYVCSKSDIAYLPAGLHSIDVVLRTEKSIEVFNGELSIELIEYNVGTNINLPILSTQANGS